MDRQAFETESSYWGEHNALELRYREKSPEVKYCMRHEEREFVIALIRQAETCTTTTSSERGWWEHLTTVASCVNVDSSK